MLALAFDETREIAPSNLPLRSQWRNSKICSVREIHPEEVTFGDYAYMVLE
jgi:hypothetical protein